jgi:hypothetical protein
MEARGEAGAVEDDEEEVLIEGKPERDGEANAEEEARRASGEVSPVAGVRPEPGVINDCGAGPANGERSPNALAELVTEADLGVKVGSEKKGQNLCSDPCLLESFRMENRRYHKG